ncbi:hypothetical protein MKW98_013776 [Papaver atlanticum]|uniref:Uncharacterized protein n=1 Tax=Papaver atlanticum TaxID=357466 RepID=A0AAD4TAI9_9MAGN|nr:hypothetical protein MKW98_013776 [Papaver atlanticum]
MSSILPCTESLKRKTTTNSSLSSSSSAERVRMSPGHHQYLCLNSEYMSLRDDLFRAIPQNPHLKPLDNYCQGVREGIRVGLDVAFINLAETLVNMGKILELSSDDVHEISAELLELEQMGYDCRKLWGRFDTVRTLLKEEKVARLKIEEFTSEKKDKQVKAALTQTWISGLESELNKLEAASKTLEEEIETLKLTEMSYIEERVRILQEFRSE